MYDTFMDFMNENRQMAQEHFDGYIMLVEENLKKDILDNGIIDKAIEYLQKAADAGIQEAIAMLDEIS